MYAKSQPASNAETIHVIKIFFQVLKNGVGSPLIRALAAVSV
ncbi:hypothetical protein EDWATA_03694 [Edwardsiella tarda ATCC 23685]|uniref:Uncharacterized protein n=1 Tax=Edwardsiella tarda ATCC 23685 TaxID=500638 RepID=D4FA76_EDWTA|nr:hypothetical protein EDWATA_03694 [Edwardsiella tarda ATCC 23685]